MKTYRSPKIEVRDNTLCGRGVVALEDIAKDEIVAIKSGHIVNAEQLANISVEVGDYALQIDDDFYLSPGCPEEVDDMTVFINHSCDRHSRSDRQPVAGRSRDPVDSRAYNESLSDTVAGRLVPGWHEQPGPCVD